MAVKSKTGTQDWFYHPPSQKITPSNVCIPPASQIPGLSQIDEQTLGADDESRYTRKWIRPSDTDYIKLAKAGGRKDLFRYREHIPSADGAVLYPRPDWFDHDNELDHDSTSMVQPTNKQYASRNPEWYGHEEQVRSIGNHCEEKKRPFLGFDEKNIWHREENNCKLPALKNKTKSRKSKSQGNYKEDVLHFPKILPRGGRKKSIDNGDMSHLLSFAYQSDFLRESKEKAQEMKRKKQDMRKERDEKVARDQHRYSKQKKLPNDDTTSTNKPLFKLSKFEKIQSKVNSHRN